MPAPTLRALRRLITLRPREWADLLVAQYTLLTTQWRVWRVPLGALVAKDSATESPDDSGERERARSLGLAVSRAAEYGVFRPFCLVRALALQHMLVANGIRGSIVRVGVRRQYGRFMAHAWVTWRGEVLGDLEAHTAKFMEVNDLRVLGNR